MTEEELKNLGYYIIRVSDDDRYLWEVFADNELLFIETSQKSAENKLSNLVKFIMSA